MPTERRVLVPLDGSGLSARTVATAADLADRLDARLLLLSVIGPFAPSAVRTRTELFLDYVLERTQAAHRPEARIARGAPDEEILSVARSTGAAMIVMSTHGRSASSRTFLGGVTESVLRSAAVPAFVMNTGVLPMPWGRLAARRTALVPLDGSLFAERAVPLAVELASVYGARIQVVRVVPAYGEPARGNIAAEYTYARREADGYLEGIARLIPVEVTVRSVIGVPAETIIRMAERESDAFVVVATRGIQHAYADSPTGVADALLQRARVPTVVLPAHAEAGLGASVTGSHAGMTEATCTSA